MSAKIIDDYRAMIESENIRVNERLTLLCQFEGVLFASLAFGWEKSFGLIGLLCLVGFVSSIAFIRSLYMAQVGIDKLVKAYNKLPEELKTAAGPVVGNYPLEPADGIPRTARIHLTPALVLPWSMTFAWVVIFVIKTAESGRLG